MNTSGGAVSRPASSSGRPGSSHAAASNAGTTVTAPNSPAATRPGTGPGAEAASGAGSGSGGERGSGGESASGTESASGRESGSGKERGSGAEAGSEAGATDVVARGPRIGRVLSSAAPVGPSSLWTASKTSVTSVTSEARGSCRTKLL